MKIFSVSFFFTRIYGMANDIDEVKSLSDKIFDHWFKTEREFFYDFDGNLDEYGQENYDELYELFKLELDNVEFSDTFMVDSHY